MPPRARKAAEPFVTLGFSAISWIEHYLVHGPGDVQGDAIDLDDEFAGFTLKAYRLHPRTGSRRVRRAFLSRAKGRSKSGFAAMIECYEALGPCRFDHWARAGEESPWGYRYEPGEPVGRPLRFVECLNVATEEGQAGNTYDAVYYMLHPDSANPHLLEDYGRIDAGLTRVLLPGKRGTIEPITTRNSSKDGGKSTFIVADETHLWVLENLVRLHQTMARNLLKRKIASGWMLETSTMYAEGEGSVAEGTHGFAKSKVGQSGALLFDHKQASDHWNLEKRRERIGALREAYGPAAAWMNLEALADSGPWDDPQVTLAEWIRFWLNRPVPLVAPEPWVIPEDIWHDLGDYGKDPAGHVGRVVLGVDSDPDRKLTSITAVGPRKDGLPLVEVLQTLPGVEWAALAVLEYADRNEVGAVVVDLASAAATLIPKLLEGHTYPDGRRLEPIATVMTTDARKYAAACGEFFDAATETRQLAHVGQIELERAIAGAMKRVIGDAWGWDRRKPTIDITPLTSGTLALYGHARAPLESLVLPQRLR